MAFAKGQGMNPTLETLDALAAAEQSASLAGGLFVGTVWLVVVLLVGAIALHIINRRFDP